MRKISLIVILLATSLFIQDINAQKEKKKEEKKSEFKVDASYRARGEVINGYKALPEESNDPNYNIDQQTRLNFSYKNDKMKFYLSLQDSRTWGEADTRVGSGNFGNKANIDAFQAWASLNLGTNSEIKLGRQALNVDDGRFIVPRGWHNKGLSYDAAAFNYKKDGFKLSVVGSYNNQNYNLFADEYDVSTANNLKSINYLHISKKINDNLYASVLSLFTGVQPQGTPTILQFKNTSGAFIKFNNKKLFAKGEAYFQMGKDVNGNDITARMFNAEAGYNTKVVYLGAGMDYLSGNTKDNQAFDYFYGARFKYYGNLNYFVSPGSTKYGGLVNPFAKVNFKFNKKNILKLTYHIFQTEQEVTNTTTATAYDKNLGSEIDIMYVHKINKEINLKVGYHTAFVSETLEAFKGITAGQSETPQWFWVMLTFKPKLFSSK